MEEISSGQADAHRGCAPVEVVVLDLHVRAQHTAKEKYTSGHTTKSMIAAVSAVLSNFFQLSGS